jgi:phosphate transport system substrate-binding protein
MKLALLAASVSGVVCAQAPAGVIRVWGSAQMADLAGHWQRGFSRRHPEVKFENHMYGAVSAIAGLYTRVADIVVSREIWPVERLAFEQVMGYPPTAIEVATGSFDVPTKSDSLEIFVHRDNPLTRLTLAQAEAIFGCDQSAAADAWSDLGLRGDWARQPIHAYAYLSDNAGSRFFRDVALHGAGNWNCRVKEFGNQTAADGKRIDAGRLILDALAGDRYGIAISNIHYTRPEVKALELAVDARGPFVAPTRENVQKRTYPLTRSVYVFLNRPPNRKADAKVEEFLRYVLSPEGQRDVSAEGVYLPLPVGRAF